MMLSRNESFRPLLTSLVALALLAPGLGRAQDGAQGTQERRGLDQVEGRNAELARAMAPSVKRAAPHVVHVRSSRGKLLGFGVVVEGGDVLTCEGILPDGNETLRVHLGEQACDGIVRGRDLANDVALLQVSWPGEAPAAIALGSAKQARIGQFVAVAGSGGEVLAAGVVSAKDRRVEPSEGGQKNVLMALFSDGNEGHQRGYPNVIHHDAPLMPEHFGAPLIDREGRLLGINVANPYRGSSHAVAIDQVLEVMPDMQAGGGASQARQPRPQSGSQPGPQTGSRAWLGISAVPASEERLALDYRYGLEVREVQGPAQTAGLKQGDVVVALDGETFTDIEVFAGRVRAHQPGDTIELTVLRGKAGLVKRIEVTLGAR